MQRRIPVRKKNSGRNGIMLKTEETMPYSNITKEELEAKLKQQKRKREASEKCPACGARRFRENSMRRFEDEIGRFLRVSRGAHDRKGFRRVRRDRVRLRHEKPSENSRPSRMRDRGIRRLHGTQRTSHSDRRNSTNFSFRQSAITATRDSGPTGRKSRNP